MTLFCISSRALPSSLTSRMDDIEDAVRALVTVPVAEALLVEGGGALLTAPPML